MRQISPRSRRKTILGLFWSGQRDSNPPDRQPLKDLSPKYATAIARSRRSTLTQPIYSDRAYICLDSAI